MTMGPEINIFLFCFALCSETTHSFHCDDINYRTNKESVQSKDKNTKHTHTLNKKKEVKKVFQLCFKTTKFKAQPDKFSFFNEFFSG